MHHHLYKKIPLRVRSSSIRASLRMRRVSQSQAGQSPQSIWRPARRPMAARLAATGQILLIVLIKDILLFISKIMTGIILVEKVRLIAKSPSELKKSCFQLIFHCVSICVLFGELPLPLSYFVLFFKLNSYNIMLRS